MPSMPRCLHRTRGYIMSDKPHLNVLGAENEAKIRFVESSEADLPEDLRAVADQLIDDAEHLESQYPARSAPALPAPGALRNRAAIWHRAAAAIVLVAAGVGGTLLAQRLITSPEAPVNPLGADRVPLAMESPDAGA